MRFSLRTLLLAFTGLVVVVGATAHRLQRRQQALAVLERHNVGIFWDDESPWDIAGCEIEPPLIVRRVQGINVGGEPLRGELLDAVLDIREVKRLVIRETEVGVRVCEALARLPHLESVSFHGTRLERGAVRAVCQQASIRELCLNFSNATDEDCEHMRRCASLQEVEIGGARITDCGLRSIASLPRLTHLFVNPDVITTAGVEEVLLRHPQVRLHCYGPEDFDEAWWSCIKARYPRAKIHR